ncbi:MerR family transcriptional regulator [Tissierella praeacuta]|uniref:MerR family transcriptional regulator n=1 Tax=Tissierella praeacuta TaxID=43131 RepID=UPI00333FCB36
MLFIKDICRITGLNSSTVRYYDSQGLLGEIKRRSNNYRVFDEKDVEKLFFIKKARTLGFELEEIKKILTLKNNGIPPCNYVSHRIQDKISFIKTEITRLEKEKEKLEKHLLDAKKVIGCKGTICHYIEGVEDDRVVKGIDTKNA